MRFPTMWYVRPAKPQISLRIRLCLSLEYSMSVKLLTEHHLEFLSLKGGCTGWSESTLVKMPHCWKSHVTAHLCFGLKKGWRKQTKPGWPFNLVIPHLHRTQDYSHLHHSCFVCFDALRSSQQFFSYDRIISWVEPELRPNKKIPMFRVTRPYLNSLVKPRIF